MTPVGDTVLATILRRQDRTRFRGRDLNARIGQHPQPLIKPWHLLADDAIFFNHQLHAAKEARRHVIIMNAAGDAPFQLAHQRQQTAVVQRLAAMLIHRHQRGDHRAGARAQPRTNRHALFQRHGDRHVFADLLTEAFPALINDILARFRRQLTGEAADVIQAEALCRLNRNRIAQQRTVHRRDRRAQHVKSDAHIGAGSRGIYFNHLKLLTSMTGYAADRQTRPPPSHHSLRHSREAPAAMADNSGCKTRGRSRRF